MKKICNSWGCTFRARIIPTVLYALISLVVTLSACTDDEHIVRQHAVPMQVSVVNSLSASRALIEDESLPGGARVGITLVDDSESTYDEKSYNNILYTSADGVKWTSENAPLLGAKQGKAVAYYPYNEDAADYTAIPVEAGTTDYMYSGWVDDLNEKNNNADFLMKHVMAGVRLELKKANYEGNAVLESLTIKSSGLAKSANMNALDGILTDVKGKGEMMQLSTNRQITDGGITLDWLAVPVGAGKDLQIECMIDGVKYKATVNSDTDFQQGQLVIWKLLLQSSVLVTQSISTEKWKMDEQEDAELIKNNPYLVLAYNVTNTSSATTLLYSTTNVAEMIVDGTSVAVAKTYTFSTTGEHEIKLRFTNNTKLADYLCYKLTNIVKIKAFPSTLETINPTAFAYCTGIKTMVRLPAKLRSIGNEAFRGCTNIKTNLVLPSLLTSVGGGAFYDCKGLLSVVVTNPSTVINGSFYNCTGIKKVVLPEGMTSLSSRWQYPNSSSYYGAFQGCTGITEINIPKSVTSIGSWFFYNCIGIKNINIPKSVTSIEEYAFQGCTGLENIIIDEDNTVYDSRNNCNAIIETASNTLIQGCNNTIIPESVTSIGNYAFYQCSGLTEVIIPNSVTTIGDAAFFYCTGLKDVVIPESVTSIGSRAFGNCTGLTEVIIPNSVTEIKESTFSGCTGMTKVTIPNLVTSIGKYAFSGCTKLTEFTIPESVKTIGERAFSACSGLSKITSHATNAPTIIYDTFYNIKTGGILYIPVEATGYGAWKGTGSYYLGYYGWTMEEYFVPTECLSLSITADDVSGRKTNTIIHYIAECKGENRLTGEEEIQTITGTVVSDEFEPNPSTESSREVTVFYSYLGVTASTTITQAPYVATFYSVELNDQWQASSVVNPDATLYDGVYESFSNYNKNSTAAIMTIRLAGYTSFTIYIRSYAESSCDYVMASVLDKTINNNTSTSDTSLVKAHTSGSQNSGTAISNYKAVTYEIPDDGEEHTITIVYRKDSSAHSGTDRGYLLIKKDN